MRKRYVHGPGVDEPLVWYEGAGTSDRRYLHADERGSIIAVTGNDGAVIANGINSYDEWGIPGTTNIGRFQFTGQKWIPELGLFDYKARMYSPTLGRFLQTDPIGYADGLNLYGYVGGDPVNKVDPTGTDDEETVVIGRKQVKVTFQFPTFGNAWNLFDFGFFGGGAAVEGGGEDIVVYATKPKAKAKVGSLPQNNQPKDDPTCAVAKTEEGSIAYEATSAAIIVGGGIVGSRGSFVNLRTGTTGSFWSIGGGAGADIGISQGIGTSSSLANLGGGGASGSVSAGIASFSGNAALGKKSITPSGSSAGIGLGVFRLGLSGTLSGTRLYGCKVRGR